MTPEDLRDDQPLLGGELEIDSIDVLQLVLEIERHFGIKLVQANFNQKHLESVNVLAAIIESKVAEAKAPDITIPSAISPYPAKVVQVLALIYFEYPAWAKLCTALG
jgi:acyl carrier protein